MTIRASRAAERRAFTWVCQPHWFSAGAAERDQARADDARAEARARKLLRRHLTPKQRRQFTRNDWFEVIGNVTGRTYRIECDSSCQNIVNRKLERRYCIMLNENGDNESGDLYLPDSDHLLAQKLLIETNERVFLRRAVMESEDYVLGY